MALHTRGVRSEVEVKRLLQVGPNVSVRRLTPSGVASGKLVDVIAVLIGPCDSRSEKLEN